MLTQKSFQTHRTGSLYLVSTPIGNLEDITLRALRTLREVDLIAAEDTRHTRKLLSFYEINAKLKSYHEHNRWESGREIVQLLLAGQSVALVSDAGMPAVSDPGYELVQLALEHEIPVIPIPGANAALAALVVSGLSPEAFTFIGFLPRDKKGLRTVLKQWAVHPQTIIVYEAPHRLRATLEAMLEAWGDRHIVLARELTKKYEEFVRGSLSDCLQHVREHGAQGEYCLVVHGALLEATSGDEHPPALSPEQFDAHAIAEVNRLIAAGFQEKDAIRETAKSLGVAKRIVYNKFTTQKNL